MAVFGSSTKAGWRPARKAFENSRDTGVASSLLHSLSTRPGTSTPSGPVASAGGTFRSSRSTVQRRKWTFSICATERLRTGGMSLARRSSLPGLHLAEKNLRNASAFPWLCVSSTPSASFSVGIPDDNRLPCPPAHLMVVHHCRLGSPPWLILLHIAVAWARLAA